MHRVFVVLAILVQSVSAPAQGSPNVLKVTALSRLYAQDQRDRGVALADDGEAMLTSEQAKAMASVDSEEMTKRDAERQRQVLDLFRTNQIQEGRDFRYASFIFQHGQTSDDYLLAHVLAVEAVVRGNIVSKWIAAATLDRYLQQIGQKQIFGTQYLDSRYSYYLQHRGEADVIPKMKSQAEETTQQPYNQLLLPDSVRQDFCVPDLSVQQNYVTLRASGQSVTLPRKADCPH